MLGAESRGRTFAEVCVLAGHTVHLYDDDANAVMDGINAIEAGLDGAETAGELDATTGIEAAVSGAGVIVESGTDEAPALQESFAEIESHADRGALLVTTARTVSVTAAAAGLRQPDRAVGFRFRDLRDVALVEIVVADQTTTGTCDRAVSFVAGLDRSPVIVGDAPGAVATRLALSIEAEAMRLVDQGVAGVDAADETIRLGYDHPVGPLEQADRAGLADRLATLDRLADVFGDRFEPPAVLRDRVLEGATGRTAGEGFYRWEDGRPVEPALPEPDLPRRETAYDEDPR